MTTASRSSRPCRMSCSASRLCSTVAAAAFGAGVLAHDLMRRDQLADFTNAQVVGAGVQVAPVGQSWRPEKKTKKNRQGAGGFSGGLG